MWLLLQSDKGLSSVRLAETLGVSQPTAWRIGHALRLMVAREKMLDGTVEIDHFYLGGWPRKRPDEPPPGRGRKGQAKTEKTPVMAVQRPAGVVWHLNVRMRLFRSHLADNLRFAATKISNYVQLRTRPRLICAGPMSLKVQPKVNHRPRLKNMSLQKRRRSHRRLVLILNAIIRTNISH